MKSMQAALLAIAIVVPAALPSCESPAPAADAVGDVTADTGVDTGPDPVGDPAADPEPDPADDPGDVAGDPIASEDGSLDATGDGGDDASDDADTPAPVSTCHFPASAALASAKVPEGFCAWTWATGLDVPRGIEVASNGDVLVVERGSERVLVLWDDDHDGVSGPQERAGLATAGGLNHGIAIHGGFLYASSSGAVYRWPYQAGDRHDLGSGQVVVNGIPTGGHATRTLAFDGDGELYVTVGSAGNVDGDSSRARMRRFPASDPPAGGWAFSSGEVFADGMRNEVGIAFDAAGRLWGVENGVDNLGRDDLGDVHDDNPAEELNLFAEPGRFYGYPYCWSEFLLPPAVSQGPGSQWAHPSFWQDGTHDDAWCRNPANVVPPRLAMPAHSAPLDITFYDGASFPGSMAGDAFVSFHGSWNRDPPTGYRVIRVVFDGGEPVSYESFLSYVGPGATGPGWPHRPVGVRVGHGGELLVTSDASGVVLAVGYEPP